ncbi:MAG: hypothetical protein Q4A72_04250 [Bacillota bacterium]|nr:hypothetical protein [Bacillota bacterium]
MKIHLIVAGILALFFLGILLTLGVDLFRSLRKKNNEIRRVK